MNSFDLLSSITISLSNPYYKTKILQSKADKATQLPFHNQPLYKSIEHFFPFDCSKGTG